MSFNRKASSFYFVIKSSMDEYKKRYRHTTEEKKKKTFHFIALIKGLETRMRQHFTTEKKERYHNKDYHS